MNLTFNINQEAKDRLRLRRQRAEELALSRKRELCRQFEDFAHFEQSYVKLSRELIRASASGDANSGQKIRQEMAALKKAQEKCLKNHGYESDYINPHYQCSLCKDQGILENGETCDCLKRLKSDLRYAGFCKELPLDGFSFDTFSLDYYEGENKKDMEKILLTCKDFAKSFPKTDNLIFSGGTGLGKTHLSLSIVRKVVANGYSAMYNSAQNFFNLIERDNFGKSDLGISEGLISCDLCVLDDLGAEFSTSFTQSALYNILNSRIIAKKPTVISTNLSPDQLESKYGDRIFSRIIGCFDWKNLSGKDIRIQKKITQRKD